MDVIFKLAENIKKTEYDDLPDQVIEVTKNFILDTIGCAIAGSTASGSKEIIKQVKSWGGSKESSILIYGGKVPAINATFVNSYMAHARDFDDSHEGALAHCNATVLPPALAISEKIGGKNGKDLITATALGVDLVARIGMGARLFQGWHFTSILGGFGAVASAGKIIGLGKEQFVNAFGIAYSQASGNRQGRKDGALTKRLQTAFSSKAGMYSVLLAKEGITGAQNVLGGEWGFYRLYGDPNYPLNYNAIEEMLTNELGKRFEGINLSAKPYPSFRGSHAPIDATLELLARNEIMPDDIEEVVVYVSRNVYETGGTPFRIRTNPQVDAQFSIPYTVSVALLKRGVGIKDFGVEEIKRNSEVLSMAERIKVIVDTSVEKNALVPVRVEIRKKNGEIYTNRVEIMKGDPEKALTFEEFSIKVRDCAGYSAKPLMPQTIEKVIQTIRDLEKLKDVKEFINILI